MTSVLGIAGGLVGAAGHVVSAQYEASVLESNAKAARQDAELARLAAAADISDIERAGEEHKATIRATAAAQGSVADVGDPLTLAVQTARDVKQASIRRHFIGEVEAAKFLTEANIYKSRGRAVKTLGYINALATALSGPATSLSSTGPRNSGGGGGVGGGGTTGGGGSSPSFGGDLL